MQGLLLSIVMKLVEGLITPEIIKGAKLQLVEYLRQLAKRSDNQLDDAIVEILAKALEVE